MTDGPAPSEQEVRLREALYKDLGQALDERNESRFKTIAFVHRHDILAALAQPATPSEDRWRGMEPDKLAVVLGEVMQDAWGEICDDTQAHPEDIRKVGRKTFYLPRHWTELIALRLHERFTLPTAPTGEALS